MTMSSKSATMSSSKIQPQLDCVAAIPHDMSCNFLTCSGEQSGFLHKPVDIHAKNASNTSRKRSPPFQLASIKEAATTPWSESHSLTHVTCIQFPSLVLP